MIADNLNAPTQTATTTAHKKGLPSWLAWGGMIGLVQIFAIATVQPLGVSTAYPQLVGYLADKIVPGFAQSHPYLQKIGVGIGWETMLILGMVLGAFLSRVTQRRSSCGETCENVPSLFQSSTARAIGAFVGGFLILFGARLANGCTSGHMLSGLAQLALSGFLFGASMFAAGLLTVWIGTKRSQA